jgi:dTDP-3-amino-2,3,6-trideoxy-4-keto-D-glucose/dTDP-3-amino-3,4,6-trideoxy-alpha-D-glucose/dTDP-2,6-dideoxy-D-kanosamine transaminase
MTNIKMFDYVEQYHALKTEMREAMERVLESGWLILGKEVRAFEEEFSSFLGGGHSVGVGNGTDAIAIALRALGVGTGDEVVTVANTAVPTVSAIRETGATPVFCDVDTETCLMDFNLLEACLSDRTKAILPVHLFGNPVDIPGLRSMLGTKGIAIVEDCAQAHGATWKGKPVGTMGDAGTFSFYPTKNLGAYGDGGLISTQSESLAAEMRSIRMYGFGDHYDSEREGVNSRLDELQAAILRVKLSHLEGHVHRRREIASLYDQHLPSSIQRVSGHEGPGHAYHLYVVRVSERDRIRTGLMESGIATGIHYPYPVHTMKAYEFLGYETGSLPATERLSGEVLSLPMYPELSNTEVMRVCAALRAIKAHPE